MMGHQWGVVMVLGHAGAEVGAGWTPSSQLEIDDAMVEHLHVHTHTLTHVVSHTSIMVLVLVFMNRFYSI